jgi:hypothetical protein
MSEEKKHRFTAKIADVEPFVFSITLDEEPIFRKAAFHVNELWRNMLADQPGKSSQYALAKVALAFAELYYRKSEQLSSQSQMLDAFENELDKILLTME